ncbi:hypothetical protein [Neorhizobium sp. T25_27]|uniref:hypothetical protein n=1 Tax=Neorhizobium sp. T25_27 TaxID=2093831 RepID=UPI00155E30B2
MCELIATTSRRPEFRVAFGKSRQTLREIKELLGDRVHYLPFTLGHALIAIILAGNNHWPNVYLPVLAEA